MKESRGNRWRYGFLYPLLAKLPRGMAYSIVYGMGGAAGLVDRSQLGQMKKNMIQVLGQEVNAHTLIKEHYRMRAMENLDPYFLRLIPSRYKVEEFMEFRNLEVLEKARRKGRGVVLFGGHYGRASLPLVGLGHMGLRVGCLTIEISQNPHLGPYEKAHIKLKSDEVQRHAGGTFARLGNVGDMKQLFSLLKQGGVVTLLLDVFNQDQNGVSLPFLKGRFRFAPGVLKFADYNQSSVVAYFAFQEKKTMVVEFQEAPAPAHSKDYDALAEYVKILERSILDRPQEWWFWPILHQLWECDQRGVPLQP